MSKLFEKFSPFALYWYLVLDIILTHIFAIVFLGMKLPLLAAITMSLDAFFKIILSVPISRLTIKIPPKRRGEISALLKLTLIMIWFVSISELSFYSIGKMAIVFFILFKLLLLIDSMLSTEFIFSLRECFSISVTQSAAVQNVLIRASTAIAPASALIILSMHYAKLVTFIIFFMLSILSTIFLRKIFFSSMHNSLSNKLCQSVSFKEIFNHPLMRWGLLYQISCNLSFAGVALLFLSELNVNGSVFFNEISSLYFAFLIAQCVVLCFGDEVIPAKNTAHISFILGLCSLFVITASFIQPGILRLLICSLIGLTYSFAISAVQKIVTTPLQGTLFIGYIGWAQTVGRLSSLVSTTLLGSLISIRISPSILLAASGILGILSANLLVIFTIKKHPKQKLSKDSLFS